jgi:hypothetical protein
MSDANDVLFGSGIPAAKFTNPGDTFGGPIVKLEATQMRKFDKKTNRPTDELDFWDNGDPKMQAVVTVRTQHRDPEDPSDDGQRKLYISSRYQQNAVKGAVKAAGKRALEIGGILQLTYTHEAPSEAGPLAKFYEATYQPPSAAAANQALGVGAPAQQVGQGIYAQQPQAQQVQIPTVEQTMAPPVQQAAPAAAAPTNLDSLPPEARAMVEKMLAAQTQQAGV